MPFSSRWRIRRSGICCWFHIGSFDSTFVIVERRDTGSETVVWSA